MSLVKHHSSSAADVAVDGPVLILSNSSTNIFVRTANHPDMSTELQNFLVSTCAPVTRPHFYNQYVMTSVSLCAAASERIYSPVVIAQILLKFSGLQELPRHFQKLLRSMEMERRLQLVLEPVDEVMSMPMISGPAADNNDGGDDASHQFDNNNPNRRRQRATTTTTTAAGGGSGGGADARPPNDAAGGAMFGDELTAFRLRHAARTTRLAYVLTSASRHTLEYLMMRPAIAKHFQPQIVGGEHKLIFTDVVREDESPSAAVSTNSHHNGSSSVANSRNTILFKAQVRPGSLRMVRELIFAQDDITVDVSYDYARDVDLTPNVEHFELRDASVLRPYQEEAVRRFLGGGSARNGIIVLPCGAGKSLTGIACAASLGKPCIVLCVNELSVLQWKRQFLMWTTLKSEQITLFTGDHKDEMPGDVFITTYAMLLSETRTATTATTTTTAGVGAGANKPAPKQVSDKSKENKLKKEKFMTAAKKKAWGALLLDECHVAVADKYQQAFDQFNIHVSVGLTATLLREDDKIGNLRFLVGPKLFEANWLELARAGHLATVHCVEVRCPLPAPLLAMYLGVDSPSSSSSSSNNNKKTSSSSSSGAADPQQQQHPLHASRRARRERIEALNPYKIWVVQALIAYHTAQRTAPADKIIIFCDSVLAIRYYALCLGLPYMSGETAQEERETIIDHFKNNPRFNVLLLTRVGDIALDIPEATVVIQLMGLGASRRQEAQRLGRVLRPKPASLFTANAFFYSIISTDTDEAIDAFSRQQWLRDQGFSYRVTDAETVMKHTEAHFAEMTAKQLKSDAGEDDAASSSSSLLQPCPVPTNRWVCVAAQTAQFGSQRGQPTTWQVRTIFSDGDGSTAAAAASTTTTTTLWRNLPPALCAVLEAAFVLGAGVLSNPHLLGTNKVSAADASASSASPVHVVIPAIRGCVLFDSVDIAQSNGSLMLFNEQAAKQPSSLYPQAALDGFVPPTQTGSGRGARRTTTGATSNKDHHHHHREQQNGLAHLLIDHPHLAVPCMDLDSVSALALCESLNVDPVTFVAPSVLASADEVMQSTAASTVAGDEGNTLRLDPALQRIKQKQQKKQNAAALLGGNSNNNEDDEDPPVILSFRLRRFSADHTCDVHNSRSMCISALLSKIDSIVDKKVLEF